MSFHLFVHLTVQPHEAAWPLLDGFIKFGMNIFKKICRENHISLKSAKTNECSA